MTGTGLHGTARERLVLASSTIGALWQVSLPATLTVNPPTPSHLQYGLTRLAIACQILETKIRYDEELKFGFYLITSSLVLNTSSATTRTGTLSNITSDGNQRSDVHLR